MVSLQIRIAYNKILESIKIEPKYVLELLKLEYEQKIREKWGESIFRNILDVQCFAEPSHDIVTSVHSDIERMRREQEYENLSALTIQDLRIWKTPLDHPILYEECYKKMNYVAPPKEQDPLMAELGLESLY